MTVPGATRFEDLPASVQAHIRAAELEARAAFGRHDPAAWELVRVANARRQMAIGALPAPNHTGEPT